MNGFAMYRAGWSCTHVTLNHPFNQDHHERIRHVHHLDGGCQPHQPHHQPHLHRRHWHEGKQTIRTVLPGPAGSGTFFCRIRIFFAGSGPFFPGPIFLPVPDLFCRIGPFLPDLDLFCRIRAFFAGSIPLLPNLDLFCWIRTFLAWSVYFLPDTDPFNRIRTYFTESGSVCRIRNFKLIQKFFVKSGDKRHIFFCDIKIIFKPA